jgi:hypothetical protein
VTDAAPKTYTIVWTDGTTTVHSNVTAVEFHGDNLIKLFKADADGVVTVVLVNFAATRQITIT